MSANPENAPAWLFSFLDLAFLILIAVLLTTDGDPEDAPDLAAIALPEIQRSSTDPLELASAAPWQLRVHPREAGAAVPPFTLLPPNDASGMPLAPDGEILTTAAAEPADELDRVDRDELGAQLRDLADNGVQKPFLAPHRDSRSEDFLAALGFVQEYWSEQHVAAVFPRTQPPAVSSPAPGWTEAP
ncbi:MAG: hypothetical protein QF570_08405 [Myxococcota bacterium]|jgi:hypothetical protein|nr:hypothetical protein [Myxococcota bacterium]